MISTKIKELIDSKDNEQLANILMQMDCTKEDAIAIREYLLNNTNFFRVRQFNLTIEHKARLKKYYEETGNTYVTYELLQELRNIFNTYTLEEEAEKYLISLEE